MSYARDLKIAARARRHGAHYPLTIARAARKTGLAPSFAYALVEKESGFRNIFGCDLGARSSVPYCRQRVTRRRVVALLRHVRAGGTSNGVGLTQLTWPGYLYDAERKGGLHRPKMQCRVGFAALAGLIRVYGRRDGCRRYNGSGPAAEAYARDMLARQAAWHRRIA